MAVLPTEVVAGGWYRTESGEERLVWIVRDGRVFYFRRTEPDRPWICAQPPDLAPPIEQFAAEVSLVDADGAGVSAKAVNDAYGWGDW